MLATGLSFSLLPSSVKYGSALLTTQIITCNFNFSPHSLLSRISLPFSSFLSYILSPPSPPPLRLFLLSTQPFLQPLVSSRVLQSSFCVVLSIGLANPLSNA
ncbi:hypothetical protein HOY80DRAFT_725871 [Tuber brumale]|nr:hypothetical protein HOY80DRAFT_725871 [Tuber brumale]